MRLILSIVALALFIYYFDYLYTSYIELWNSYPVSTTILSIFLGPSIFVGLLQILFLLFAYSIYFLQGIVSLFVEKSKQPISIDEIKLNANEKVSKNIDTGNYKAGYNSIEEYNQSNIPYYWRMLKDNLDWKPYIKEKRPLSNWWFHKIISLSILFLGLFSTFQGRFNDEKLVLLGVTFFVFFIYNFFNRYENQFDYEIRIERMYRDYLYAKIYIKEHIASEAKYKREKEIEEARMVSLRQMSRRDRANENGFDEFGFETKAVWGFEKREYQAKRKRAKEREKERKRYDNHRSSERRVFTYLQRREVYDRDEGICQICGCSVTWNNYECDHIRPWSKGGKTTVQNAQCTCITCNRSKSAKHEH